MTQEDYAAKIAKILAKAEDPACSAAEAQTFVEAAQRLMTKWAIDEAMVAKAKGDKEPEKIVEEELVFSGTWGDTYRHIAWQVCEPNDVRALFRDDFCRLDATRETDAWKQAKGKRAVLSLIGFESDVKRVRMLNSSLQIQAIGAEKRWWNEYKNEPRCQYMTAGQKWRERRQFYWAFASGVAEQLAAARKAAVKEADTKTEGDSVALVLRDKKDRVNDWMDQTYGKLRSRRSTAQGGSMGAYGAGLAAGRAADAGGSGRVAGGIAGELGR